MKINPHKIVFDLDNNPVVRRNEAEPDKPIAWTIGTVIIEALMSDANPKRRTGLDRYEAGRISEIVHDAGENGVELTPEETVIVKEAVGCAFPQILVKPVWDVLNGKDT